MEHAGFKANIMEAERLAGERTHALPPGSALPVHRVSEFKKHPDNWMEEDGCYVVPVKPNKGLWFDWTMNEALNTAVVPTVKGCNPITGLKTDRLGLERYENNCPKHDIKFTDDRYCEKCGYKWPAQNYVAHPNTSWWDGFRADDGSVRQFFITEDMMRDIASHMIGKENTVPAFGFAFFKPKKTRREAVLDSFTISNNGCGCGHWHCGCGHWYHPFNSGPIFGDVHSSIIPNSINGISNEHIYLSNNSNSADAHIELDSIQCSATGPQNYSQDEIPVLSQEEAEAKFDLSLKFQKKSKNVLRSMSMSPSAPKKEVAIGAGAKIEQGLIVDPYELDSWKEEPDSIMRIYFVFQNEFDHWKSFGMKDLDGKINGMLDNLPVG